MKNRVLILSGAGLSLVAMIALLILEPTRIGMGFLRGESFYQGRPTSYWKLGLADDSPSTRLETVHQLKAGGADAVPVVVALIGENRGESWEAIERRWTLAEILGAIGPPAAPAVPVLVELLQDPDHQVRSVAALALGQIGPTAKQAVTPLITLVNSREKLPAIKALGYLRGEAKEAVPVLIPNLKDPELDVRWTTAKALDHIGPDAKAALPALAELLKDSEPQTRSVAAEAIWAIGADPAVVPALAAIVQDPEAEVQAYALRALHDLGPAAKEAVPSLKQAYKSDDPRIREAVGKALKQIDPAAAEQLGIK